MSSHKGKGFIFTLSNPDDDELRGCPKELATFPRVWYNEGLSDYRLDAKQYFEPEAVNAKSVALYKVLVQPKGAANSNSKRLFKLLQSRHAAANGGEPRYVYEVVEVKELPALDMKILFPYAPNSSEGPDSPPHIRRVASDVLFFLNNNAAFALNNPVPRALEVLDDGHGGFQFFSAAADEDPRQ